MPGDFPTTIRRINRKTSTRLISLIMSLYVSSGITSINFESISSLASFSKSFVLYNCI